MARGGGRFGMAEQIGFAMRWWVGQNDKTRLGRAISETETKWWKRVIISENHMLYWRVL